MRIRDFDNVSKLAKADQYFAEVRSITVIFNTCRLNIESSADHHYSKTLRASGLHAFPTQIGTRYGRTSSRIEYPTDGMSAIAQFAKV